MVYGANVMVHLGLKVDQAFGILHWTPRVVRPGLSGSIEGEHGGVMLDLGGAGLGLLARLSNQHSGLMYSTGGSPIMAAWAKLLKNTSLGTWTNEP